MKKLLIATLAGCAACAVATHKSGPSTSAQSGGDQGPPLVISARDTVNPFTHQPYKFPVTVTATYDDSPGLQERIDVAKAHSTPFRFPPGYYLVCESLDLTNGPTGFEFEGSGKGSTIIESALKDPYPTIDLTGTSDPYLSGFMVTSSHQHTDNATVGILIAREGSSPKLPDGKTDPKHSRVGYGDQPVLDRVIAIMFGPSAVAGLVDVGADLLDISDCQFSGPAGVVIDVVNVKAVKSAYQALPHDSDSINSTMQTLRNCAIHGSKTACVEFGNGSSLSLHDDFFSVGGEGASGVSAVKITGNPNAGDQVYMDNCREESLRNGSPTYLVDIATDPLANGMVGGGSSGGQIQGSFHVNGGPYIHGHKGNALSNYTFQMTCDHKDQYGKELSLIGGDSSDDAPDVRGSTIFRSRALPMTLGQQSSGNVLIPSG